MDVAKDTLRKKESRNGSPRRAIWLSVTQLSLEIMKKKWLSSTKESRFSKLLSKRAILALFFSQCNWRSFNNMALPVFVVFITIYNGGWKSQMMALLPATIVITFVKSYHGATAVFSFAASPKAVVGVWSKMKQF